MFPGSTIGSVGPGVAYLRVHKTTQLYRGMKAHYGVSLTYGGRSISRVDGCERVRDRVVMEPRLHVGDSQQMLASRPRIGLSAAPPLRRDPPSDVPRKECHCQVKAFPRLTRVVGAKVWLSRKALFV